MNHKKILRRASDKKKVNCATLYKSRHASSSSRDIHDIMLVNVLVGWNCRVLSDPHLPVLF